MIQVNLNPAYQLLSEKVVAVDLYQNLQVKLYIDL